MSEAKRWLSDYDKWSKKVNMSRPTADGAEHVRTLLADRDALVLLAKDLSASWHVSQLEDLESYLALSQELRDLISE